MRRIKRLISLAMAGALLLCTTISEAFADGDASANAEETVEVAETVKDSDSDKSSKKEEKKEEKKESEEKKEDKEEKKETEEKKEDKEEKKEAEEKKEDKEEKKDSEEKKEDKEEKQDSEEKKEDKEEKQDSEEKKEDKEEKQDSEEKKEEEQEDPKEEQQEQPSQPQQEEEEVKQEPKGEEQVEEQKPEASEDDAKAQQGDGEESGDKAEESPEAASDETAGSSEGQTEDAEQSADKADATSDKEEKDQKDDEDDEEVRLSLSISSPSGLPASGGVVQVDPTQVDAITLSWKCEGSADSFEVGVSSGFSKSTRETSVKIPVSSLSANTYTATVEAIRDDRTVAKEHLKFRIVDPAEEREALTEETEEEVQAEAEPSEQSTEAEPSEAVEPAEPAVQEETIEDNAPNPEALPEIPEVIEERETHLTLSMKGMQGLTVVGGAYRIDPAQASALTLVWTCDGDCDGYEVSVSGGLYSGKTSETSLSLPLSGVAAGHYTATVSALKDGNATASASLSFEIVSKESESEEDFNLSLTVTSPQGLMITDGVYQVDPTEVDSLTLAWQCDGDCNSFDVSVSGGVYSDSTTKKSLTLPTGSLPDGQYTVTVEAVAGGEKIARAELIFEIAQPEASDILTVAITDPKDAAPVDGVYTIDPTKVTSLTIQWQCSVECDSYKISVSGDAYSGETQKTKLKLSLDKLAAGRYTVTVTAIKDGQPVAEAQLTFQLTDGQQPGPDDQPQGDMPQGGMPRGGMPKGGMPKGAQGVEEDTGFHITPGEALTNTHTSGNRDMSYYGAISLVLDSEDSMTQLTFGDTELDIRLSDGGAFNASMEENTLALVPVGDAEAWLLNGHALKTLALSGIETLSLTLNDVTVDFPTRPQLSGKNYGALCAAGWVSKDYGYAVYADAVTVTVADQTFRLTQDGELA